MRLSDSHTNPHARLIGLLAFGHCMAFIDRNLPAATAPLLKADLHLSDTQLGVLDGPAFAMLYVAGMLLSWPMARSPHRLRLLTGCMATWMFGMLMFALSHSLFALVMARALVGLGQAAFVPLALGLIVECSLPRWRARCMAIFTAGAAAGRSLSLLLGGAALALFAKWLPDSALAHWRLLFLAMAAPNLLLIVLLWQHPEPSLMRSAPSKQLFGQMLASFRDRSWATVMYLCGAGASVLVVQTIGAWAPSVLHREHGLTPAMASLVFGASLLVASPIGHFIGGALVDKRGEKLPPTSIVSGALLLVVPVLWAIPIATSPIAACVFLALASLIGGTAALAALAGLPAMLSPPLRDAGLRVFLAFITVTGVALGPLMAGMVSDGLGLGGHRLSLALNIVCIGAAIAGIVAALLARNAWRSVAMEATA